MLYTPEKIYLYTFSAPLAVALFASVVPPLLCKWKTKQSK